MHSNVTLYCIFPQWNNFWMFSKVLQTLCSSSSESNFKQLSLETLFPELFSERKHIKLTVFNLWHSPVLNSHSRWRIVRLLSILLTFFSLMPCRKNCYVAIIWYMLWRLCRIIGLWSFSFWRYNSFKYYKCFSPSPRLFSASKSQQTRITVLTLSCPLHHSSIPWTQLLQGQNESMSVILPSIQFFMP